MGKFEIMQIDFQYSSVWIALFAGLFLILLVLQLILIQRNQSTSPKRKAVKIGLNLFFFTCLLLLLIQPYIYREYMPQNVLVYDTEVSEHFVNHLSDSLNLKNAIPIDSYEKSADNIFLAGQRFTPVQLGKLQEANITWIPYHSEGAVMDIRWNGLLRQGQSQTLYGTYNTDREVYLTLLFGDEVLDSVLVGPSDQNFRLTTQAKAIGRNQLSLTTNGQELGKIRFFVTENNPIHYQMHFSYPDMEIRHLSGWLGRKGQGITASVQTSTSVIQQSTNIEMTDTLQFLITEPAFANSKVVGEAIASGATILFTNFGNVDRELLQINRALGTAWSVNRSHTEGSRTIEGSLTALPYKLIAQPQQWELLDAAVGYQRIGSAKVGVSLLDATFPIALQGDSIGYAAVWDRIFYAMRPAEGIIFNIPQPLFTSIGPKEWNINSPHKIEEILSIETDSIFLSPSPINPRSHTGYYKTPLSGWTGLADTLEIYFHGEEDDFQFVRHKNQINQFIQYQQDKLIGSKPIYQKQQLSDWWWFALLLLSATLLWIEPRVDR